MSDAHPQLPAVIMYHPKDWEVLPYCIWGLTKNTPCNKIYVVGRKSEQARVSSLHPRITYIDENAVVAGLTFQSNAHPRWGWYLQQILKLSMANMLSEPYYVTIDADTVFLRKTAFFDDGKPLYATGTEYHLPYFKFIEKALGWPAQREFSFIAHHMVFSAALVREMQSRFKSKPWYQSVLSCMQDENRISFSEFETYGHYMKRQDPNSFKLRELCWRNVPGSPSLLKLKGLSWRYDFCSFHAYTRDVSNIEIIGRALRSLFGKHFRAPAIQPG